MGTLQENQSLNGEYERNKKEREMKEEIERLHSIIKEVREKLNNYTTRMEVLNYQISDLTKKELLEILDKGSDKE